MRSLCIAVLALITLIVGCSAKFKTAKFDIDAWTIKSQPIEGIVYYEPHQVLITYEFTALIDKDGKFIGTSNENKCKRVIQKQELAIEANFNEPRVLLNEPSPFAEGKLSANFSNGMIVSINSESKPQLPELIKEIAGFTKEVAAVVARSPKPDMTGLPACNAAPIIANKTPWTKIMMESK